MSVSVHNSDGNHNSLKTNDTSTFSGWRSQISTIARGVGNFFLEVGKTALCTPWMVPVEDWSCEAKKFTLEDVQGAINRLSIEERNMIGEFFHGISNSDEIPKDFSKQLLASTTWKTMLFDDSISDEQAIQGFQVLIENRDKLRFGPTISFMQERFNLLPDDQKADLKQQLKMFDKNTSTEVITEIIKGNREELLSFFGESFVDEQAGEYLQALIQHQGELDFRPTIEVMQDRINQLSGQNKVELKGLLQKTKDQNATPQGCVWLINTNSELKGALFGDEMTDVQAGRYLHFMSENQGKLDLRSTSERVQDMVDQLPDDKKKTLRETLALLRSDHLQNDGLIKDIKRGFYDEETTPQVVKQDLHYMFENQDKLDLRTSVEIAQGIIDALSEADKQELKEDLRLIREEGLNESDLKIFIEEFFTEHKDEQIALFGEAISDDKAVDYFLCMIQNQDQLFMPTIDILQVGINRLKSQYVNKKRLEVKTEYLDHVDLKRLLIHLRVSEGTSEKAAIWIVENTSYSCIFGYGVKKERQVELFRMMIEHMDQLDFHEQQKEGLSLEVSIKTKKLKNKMRTLRWADDEGKSLVGVDNFKPSLDTRRANLEANLRGTYSRSNLEQKQYSENQIQGKLKSFDEEHGVIQAKKPPILDEAIDINAGEIIRRPLKKGVKDGG